MPGLNNWYENNTFHYKQFSIPKLIRLKNKKPEKISLCFPTLNEAPTIGKILLSVKKYIFDPGLVDEVVIIDSDSTDNTVEIAKASGFKVYQQGDILPGQGTYKGKGDALWKSLSILQGDIIVWCDSDIMNFKPMFIYGLLGPLLNDDIIIDEELLYLAAGKTDLKYDEEVKDLIRQAERTILITAYLEKKDGPARRSGPLPLPLPRQVNSHPPPCPEPFGWPAIIPLSLLSELRQSLRHGAGHRADLWTAPPCGLRRSQSLVKPRLGKARNSRVAAGKSQDDRT